MGRTKGIVLTHLRAWREARLVEAKELAQRTGISPSTISHYEHEGAASIATIKRIAAGLNITPEELLSQPKRQTSK